MDSKLREQIIDILERNCFARFGIQADKILSLLAPVLADAERWKKVKKIARHENKSCKGCPMVSFRDMGHSCDGACVSASYIVDALSKEES